MKNYRQMYMMWRKIQVFGLKKVKSVFATRFVLIKKCEVILQNFRLFA